MSAGRDAELANATRRVRQRKAWQFTAWSAGSIVAGALFWAWSHRLTDVRSEIVRTVAVQFIAWGLINAIFAALGLRGAATPRDVATELAERARLIRVLHWNKWLNLLWVSIGVLLLAAACVSLASGAPVKTTAAIFGHGAGVLAQAAFLMGFDRRFLEALRAIGSRQEPAGL